MLKHFEKLQTPLKAVNKYSTLDDQRQRFLRAGWLRVEVQTLWDYWQCKINLEQKRALDVTEPFDEWEEFALFASHYFLLIAHSTGPMTAARFSANQESLSTSCVDLAETRNPLNRGQRRFGAAIEVENGHVVFQGGMGPKGRLGDWDVYKAKDCTTYLKTRPPQAAYVCHTITRVGPDSFLLVGGRTSPDNANPNCWLIKGGSREMTGSLHPARYRHSAVRVRASRSDEPGVLVFGGKTGSGIILSDWMLWTRAHEWRKLIVVGEHVGARFGAAMATSPHSAAKGILLGGMSEDGKIYKELWEWELDFDNLTVVCRLASPENNPKASDMVHRFGASIVPFSSSYILVGGITNRQILEQAHQILLIPEDLNLERGQTVHHIHPGLFVGAGVTCTEGGQVLIVGGGAVCFSFGAFWNESYYTLQERQDTSIWAPRIWEFSEFPNEELGKAVVNDKQNASGPNVKKIPRQRVERLEDFENILARREPVIIEGLNLGRCTHLWTLEYLRDRIGAEREVSDLTESLQYNALLTRALGRRSFINYERNGFQEKEFQIHHSDLLRLFAINRERRNVLLTITIRLTAC
jgi:tRNA wybutosine-synthesizing protein 4